MYDFVDPNEYATNSGRMPESFSFDGKWIEDEIPGFFVTGTTGRELRDTELKTQDIGYLDGSKYLARRWPARVITVSYVIISPSTDAFRKAFNKLNQLLMGEQKRLIFADEADKFFIATKTGNSEVEPGKNAVVGQIEFTCTDPLKYSAAEKVATMSEDTIHLVNDGTVPVPIRYEITHSHENGYVGISNAQGAMEFGKREEADGESYKENEKLATLDDFKAKADTGSAALDSMHPDQDVTGSCAVKTWFGKDWLTYGAFGSKTSSVVSGGQRKIVLKADSAGEVGAKNWYCYLFAIMWAGRVGQIGEFNINFETSDGKQIAGINWFKNDMSGNTGAYELWANGKLLKMYTYTTDGNPAHNPYMKDNGHCDIKKEGSKLTFYYWGQYPSFVIPEIEDMVCTQISINMKGYRNDRHGMLTHMGLSAFDFYKLNVSKWKDVPNRYPSGSVVTADGEPGKFYVNGMLKPQEEILGTNWFKAQPGDNEISLSFSTFCDPKPEVKAFIREAWL